MRDILIGKERCGKDDIGEDHVRDSASEGAVEVMIDGKCVDASDVSCCRRYVYGRTVMLHQEYALYTGTVLTNLTSAICMRMPAELAGMKANPQASRIFRNADEVMRKNSEELSVGQRHRIALAQVFMKGSDIA